MKTPILSLHAAKGGTGKSTIASLFAIQEANDGKRVCLIDLDFTNPGLHHILEIPEPDKGILDYMIISPNNPYQHTPLNDIIIPIQENLSLIPGKIDCDKFDSIQSYLLADIRASLLKAKINYMLETLQPDFDIFIIDTPSSLFGASQIVADLNSENKFQIFVSSLEKQSWMNLTQILNNQKATIIFNKIQNDKQLKEMRKQMIPWQEHLYLFWLPEFKQNTTKTLDQNYDLKQNIKIINQKWKGPF